MTVQTLDTQNYALRRKGGRSLVDHAPLFSPDGQSLLLICENTVRIYNVKTGECSRVLEQEVGTEEAGALLAIRFVPEEPHNLYGCSVNGYVTVWSWEQRCGVLREKKLPLRDQADNTTVGQSRKIKVLTFDMLEPNTCLVTGLVQHSSRPFLAKYCLKTNTMIFKYTVSIKYSYIWQVAIGFSNDNRFAVICDGTADIHAYNLSHQNGRCRSHTNLNKIRVICVAAHPTESTIVTGDALGRAIVWKGNLCDSQNLWGREILHWHNLPVFAAAFSSQGGYLLTGGLERVVVKWHLGSLAASAQQKETLPRLPGAVKHIAVSVPYIAIATNSNSIVITTPQLRLVSTILECGGLMSKFGTSLVYHPPLATLLLGGRPGHLQFFSTTTDQLLYNVDIAGVNTIPITRENPAPVDFEVTCAAVSADGSWLVTSEYRSDGNYHPEEFLKFWAFTPNSPAPVTLNTCVSFSHGGCRVFTIAINSSSDYAVTAGTDQKFRIWRRDFSLVNNRRKVFWTCITACYYSPGVGASLDQNIKNMVKDRANTYDPPYLREKGDDFISEFLGVGRSVKKDVDVGSIRKLEASEAELELGGVAVSQDGSLIAAWFGSRLTLWDSHTCTLRSVLSHPSLGKGVDVVFGNDDAAHYLVCTTKHCVAVWSLLSLSVRWQVHARPVTLAADPASNRIAVVTDQNDVFVFTPHSSKPLLTRRAVLAHSRGVLRHCVFGPSTQNDFCLYLMRNDSEIYSLEPVRTEAALEAVSRVSLPVSNFGALVAQQQTSEVQKKEAAVLEDINVAGSPVSVFSAASHMMPSVSLLCTSLLHQLSGLTEEETPQDEPQVISDDSASEDETEGQEDGVRTDGKKVELWKTNYETNVKRARKILKRKMLREDLIRSLLS